MKSASPSAGPPGLQPQNVLGAWLTPWRFAGMVALLIALCFPSVLLGLDAFVYGDMGQFAYPVAFFHRESFWHGEIPLWNPLNSCGIPFLAQWNTLTCYPPSLFYLVFPMPWSFDVFCLAHILLAAMGMYFLAYRWTNNRFAAAVAGIVFGFNGLTWQAIMWPHFLAALAWMPWFLLAMEKAWNTGGRALIPAVLAGAMQMLSGGVEVIIQTWLLLGALWVLQLVRGDIPRPKLIYRMLAIGLLIAGLSAIQIFPFLDLLAHSQRTSTYGSGAMDEIGSMSPAGIFNYLVPLFQSVRNPQGVFVQIRQSWVSSYYLGIGGVTLGLFGLWRVRDRRVWFLGCVVIFSLLMALGEQGYIYKVMKALLPVLGFIRFSVKFVALTTFAIPLLAAFGINCLLAAPAESWRREWTRAKGLALTLIGIMAGVLLFARLHPLDGESLSLLGGNVAVRVVVMGMILGCIAFSRRNLDLKLQRVLPVVILVLLWFDVFTHTSNLSPSAPRAVLKADVNRAFFGWDHQMDAGVSRALESQDSFWKMFSTGLSDPGTDTYFRRRAFPLDMNLLDHVAKFDGFYSLDLKEHIDVFKRVFFTTNDAPKLKDFAGISQVSNPTNVFDWVARDSFLPLVTAGQKPVFMPDSEALSAIFSGAFEPRRTVYLPLEAADKVRVTEDPGAKITSVQFSSQHVEIETESGSAAMVTIAQTFYHPWHAYVDGQRTRLWRANYAFQALEVPAGKHQVRLVYEDAMFFSGMAVSLLTGLGCAIAWFWGGHHNSLFSSGPFRGQMRFKM